MFNVFKWVDDLKWGINNECENLVDLWLVFLLYMFFFGFEVYMVKNGIDVLKMWIFVVGWGKYF